MTRGVGATVLAAAFLAGPGPRAAEPQSAAPQAGTAMAQAGTAAASPETLGFTLKDLEGGAVDLSRLRGRPVIVDFWATWCPPCRKEIPELKRLYARYHKSKGLAVVGVACDAVRGEGVAAVRPFVKKFAVTYPVVMADDAILDRLGVEVIPTTLFVGPDGQEVGRLTGAPSPAELAGALKRLFVRPRGGAGARPPDWISPAAAR